MPPKTINTSNTDLPVAFQQARLPITKLRRGITEAKNLLESIEKELKKTEDIANQSGFVYGELVGDLVWASSE